MNRENSNQRRGLWSPNTLLFLLLAASVFTWGTSYKLSLYKTNASGSGTPAKLCKLTSENAKSELDHALDGHQVFTAAFLTDVPLLSRDVAFVVLRQVILLDAQRNLAPLRVAPVLRLRPPPVQILRLLL